MQNLKKKILPQISLVIINQFFPETDSFRRYKKAISMLFHDSKFQDDRLTFTPVIVGERKCTYFQKYFFY